MELENVKQITETTSESKANKYIDSGWVLIATASMTTNSNEYSSPVIKYSLAWVEESDPVIPQLN